MSIDVAHLSQLLQTSLQRLGNRVVRLLFVLGAGTILLSVILAPQAEPSAADWFRIIIIAILAGCGILSFASSQDHAFSVRVRQHHLYLATGFVLVALILNLTFSLATTLLFSTALSILGLMLANDRGLNTFRTIAALLVGTIPLWIWSALDAWTAGLLLLIPLGVIGVITDGHMRLAALPAADQRHLSRRGHRLAARVGVLGAALLMLLTAAATSAETGPAALGALGALALVSLEATSARATVGSWHSSSVTLVDAALLWIALSWIVSLS